MQHVHQLDPSEPLAPGTRIDHFQVMRLLGSGGMAEVYLARDTRLGRRVALKRLRADAVGSGADAERFRFEARAVARFSHPHIVTVFAVGGDGRRPYLAMEYLEGETLRARLRGRRPLGGRLGAGEVLRIGLAVAEALEAAHAQGILHLDLKPANVMLARDGRPRVLDFGLARALPGTEGAVPPEEHPGEPPVRGTPAYMAPEQWRGEEPDAAADIWSLGVMLHEMVTGERPFRGDAAVEIGAQVLSPEPVPPVDTEVAVPADLTLLIADCLRKAPGARPPAAVVVSRIRAALERDRDGGVGERSPFRGLVPFDEADRHRFFGRDAEIAAAVEQLHVHPLLTVVGPSGAGKSSFVAAGVIPRLRERGPLTVLRLRPGRDPLRALADRVVAAQRALQPGAADAEGDDVDTLAGRLVSLPSLLTVVLHRLAERAGSTVLLFVDQLEELVTLDADPAARSAFLRAVCGAADDPAGSVCVALTLREEFLGRLAEPGAVREALSRIAMLRPPGGDALREILTRPVEAAGYGYDDPGLVARMVDEVEGGPACLPLLQFVGQLLWARRDRERSLLCARVHDEIGGVGGALARHADGVLEGLDEDQVGLARALLLRLVTADGTRRAAPRDELVGGLDGAAEGVLDRLVDARLVVERRVPGTPGGELELVHESLIAAWGRLARWFEESREELALLREIEQAAALWTRRGQRADEVWEGDALREAQRVVQRATDAPAAGTQAFLAAGAARTTRAQRRRRVLLGLVFLQLLAAAALFAWQAADARKHRREAEHAAERARAAEHEARTNLARSLADQAAAADAIHESLLFAAASLEADENPGARGVLAGLLDRPRPRLLWGGGPGVSCVDLRFAPDGTRLACASRTTGLRVWDLAGDGDELAWSGQDELPAWRLAYAPAGDAIAVGRLDGEVRIYDAADGIERQRLIGQRRTVVDLAFAPDGERLVSASIDGSVVVWDLARGTEVARLEGRCDEHYGVAWVAGGERVLAGCLGGDVLDWDVGGDGEVTTLYGHPKDVSGIEVLDDGRLVSSSDDGTLVVWALDGGGERLRVEVCEGRSGALDRLPGDQQVALTCLDGSIEIRALADGALVRRIEAHHGMATAAAVGADGRRLATSGFDGSVTLWDLASGTAERSLAGHPARPIALHVAADAGIVLSADEHGAIWLWDLDGGAPLQGLAAEGIYAPLPTADGRRIAAGSGKGPLRLLERQSGAELVTLIGHEGWSWPLAFCDGDTTLLTGGKDHTLRRWSLADGALLETVPAPAGAEGLWVAASEDCSAAAASLVGGPVVIWDRGSGRERTRVEPDSVYHRAVALSADGRRVAVGQGDSSLRVWDAVDGARIAELPGHEATVLSVVFSADGQLLASGSSDKTARVWDLDSGAELAQLRHGARVLGVALDGPGERLLTAAGDGRVRAWAIDLARPDPVLRGHRELVAALAFADGGEILRSAGFEGAVVSWDVLRRAPVDRLTLPEHGARLLELSADGQLLLTDGPEHELCLWDLARGERRQTLRGHLDSIRAALLLPGGERALAYDRVAGLLAWDLTSGGAETLAVARDARETLRPIAMAAAPDGVTVAMADSMGMVLVVDSVTGHAMAQAQAPLLLDLAFDADGVELAGAAADGSVRRWRVPAALPAGAAGELAGGGPIPVARLPVLEPLSTFARHDNLAIRVAYDPTGRWLASGGYDRVVRVWDRATGEERARLPGFARSAGLAFADDGRTLATAQDDGSVQLWDLEVLGRPVGDLLEQVAAESGLRWDGQRVTPDPAQVRTRLAPTGPR